MTYHNNIIATNGYSRNLTNYKEWVETFTHNFFITFTPKNPKTPLKRLIDDTNKVLTKLTQALKKKGEFIDGFGFIENSKIRAGGQSLGYLPHIHILVYGLDNVTLKRFKNLAFNAACSIRFNKKQVFDASHIDVQSVRKGTQSTLIDYLLKTAKFKKNLDATDFIIKLHKSQMTHNEIMH